MKRYPSLCLFGRALYRAGLHPRVRFLMVYLENEVFFYNMGLMGRVSKRTADLIVLKAGFIHLTGGVFNYLVEI